MSATNGPTNGTLARIQSLELAIRDERDLRRADVKDLNTNKADKDDVVDLKEELKGMKHALYYAATALILAAAGFSFWALQIASGAS